MAEITRTDGLTDAEQGRLTVRRLEIACSALGAVLIIAGVALVFWPAAIIVAGGTLVVAAWSKDDR